GLPGFPRHGFSGLKSRVVNFEGELFHAPTVTARRNLGNGRIGSGLAFDRWAFSCAMSSIFYYPKKQQSPSVAAHSEDRLWIKTGSCTGRVTASMAPRPTRFVTLGLWSPSSC
ncbi:MAG: hypothetical protein Q8M07_02875, partial [Prosthecobacter sp.]|nr:hypothetical protein [Prosthecobacter sp.]